MLQRTTTLLSCPRFPGKGVTQPAGSSSSQKSSQFHSFLFSQDCNPFPQGKSFHCFYPKALSIFSYFSISQPFYRAAPATRPPTTSAPASSICLDPPPAPIFLPGATAALELVGASPDAPALPLTLTIEVTVASAGIDAVIWLLAACPADSPLLAIAIIPGRSCPSSVPPWTPLT